MGIVFKVEKDGKEYALKICNTTDDEYVSRFKREIRMMETINNNRIVKIIDKDIDASIPYFIMELCDESLENAVATGGKNNAAQHDRVMTREKIEDCINTCTEAILSQFDTVGDLNDFDFEASKGNKKLDDQITMRLGLPMFLSLMDKFNIKEIHVSGTGLWYGIYLQYLHNISDK